MNLDRLVPSPAGVVECTVTGCGWRAEVPPLFRIVPIEYEAPTFADPGHKLIGTRVEPDEAACAAFDAYIAGHLEQHALAETLLGEQNPPGSTIVGVYRGTECRLHPDDPGPADG